MINCIKKFPNFGPRPWATLPDPLTEIEQQFKDLAVFNNGIMSANIKTSSTKDKYSVSIDLPGYSPEDTQISVPRQSIIKVTAHNTTRGDYTEEIIIPSEWDIDTASATMEHGVLTVSFTNIVVNIGKSIPINSPL